MFCSRMKYRATMDGQKVEQMLAHEGMRSSSMFETPTRRRRRRTESSRMRERSRRRRKVMNIAAMFGGIVFVPWEMPDDVLMTANAYIAFKREHLESWLTTQKKYPALPSCLWKIMSPRLQCIKRWVTATLRLLWTLNDELTGLFSTL